MTAATRAFPPISACRCSSGAGAPDHRRRLVKAGGRHWQDPRTGVLGWLAIHNPLFRNVTIRRSGGGGGGVSASAYRLHLAMAKVHRQNLPPTTTS